MSRTDRSIALLAFLAPESLDQELALAGRRGQERYIAAIKAELARRRNARRIHPHAF